MACVGNAINRCFANYDVRLEEYKELYKSVFSMVLLSINKMLSHREEEHKMQSTLSGSETQVLDGIIDVLIQIAFKIPFSPIANKDPEIWADLDSLCLKLIENEGSKKIVEQIWRATMISLTTTFVDALCKITPEELQVLSHPAITPFKDLPMRNEYSLQILFNAFNSKSDPIYAKVLKLKLYNELCENWLKFLQLMKIPIEPSNTEVLLNYFKSIFKD